MENEKQNPEKTSAGTPIFFFEEGEKWKEISFELLCQSKAYLNANRRPPDSRPVEAYELIEEVNAILDKYGIVYYIQPILVQANGSENVMTRKERAEIPANETPIDTWVFNKILIQWIFAFEGELKPGISCAFHDKGIDLAFGIYNRVCTNHCIFGDKWFTTYSTRRSQKKSYDDLMNALRVWLDDYHANISLDIAAARMMMQMVFTGKSTEDVLDTVIGALLRLAVRQNMPGNPLTAPFNITNVIKIARGFEGKRINRTGIDGAEQDITLWEIYNAGTALLKPSDTDISDIHASNKEWGTFLLERYFGDFYSDWLDIMANHVLLEIKNGTYGQDPDPEKELPEYHLLDEERDKPADEPVVDEQQTNDIPEEEGQKDEKKKKK